MQVHKETIDKVPNSIPNRSNIEIEIFGMDGMYLRLFYFFLGETATMVEKSVKMAPRYVIRLTETLVIVYSLIQVYLRKI